MFSFNMFDHPIPRVFQNRFSTQYRCFSVSMLAGPNDRSDVEKGGKIIMPPSALDQLSRLNITYPMLFKLTNKNSDRMTHCGVLEFVADEGICYLPHWMMQNLLLEEGGLVQVESVNLQVATYSKFQPQSPDFLDITNPKAVLENALRNFACLTTGDVIAINYNEKIYELRVMETKPDKAVSIIECDMNVDFDAPLGYKEPERQTHHEESTDVEADHSGYVGDLGFRAFSGSGNRLDGKKKGVEPNPSPIKPEDIRSCAGDEMRSPKHLEGTKQGKAGSFVYSGKSRTSQDNAFRQLHLRSTRDLKKPCETTCLKWLIHQEPVRGIITLSVEAKQKETAGSGFQHALSLSVCLSLSLPSQTLAPKWLHFRTIRLPNTKNLEVNAPVFKRFSEAEHPTQLPLRIGSFCNQLEAVIQLSNISEAEWLAMPTFRRPHPVPGLQLFHSLSPAQQSVNILSMLSLH